MDAIELDGATVAVTGAGRGIGLAIAAAFAERGARVAIGDIDEALAREAAGEIEAAARGFELDVRSRESFADFITATEAALGPLEVLVNNAGVMPVGRFLSEDDADTTNTLAVNLWGPIHGMRLAIPPMVERGRGHVVNVASLMGKFHLPGMATYSAAKHAVVGLTGAVRDEIADTGVTVTAVLPSAVRTELISGIPIPRALPTVAPEDVAGAVVGSCRNRPGEVVVPGWLGTVESLSEVAPERVIGAVRRLIGHDRALQFDQAKRAAYERRARKPDSG